MRLLDTGLRSSPRGPLHGAACVSAQHRAVLPEPAIPAQRARRGREQEAAVPFVTSSWKSLSVTSVIFYWSDPNQSIQTQGKGLSGTPCGGSLSRGPHRQLHPARTHGTRSDRFLPISVSPVRTAACLAH